MITGILGLLIANGAAWSYAFSSGRVAQGRLLLHPEQMDGQDIVLSLVKVVEVGDDRYAVRSGKQQFEVLGTPDGLDPGVELYVGGRFQSDGLRVVEEWRELAPQRSSKKALGILGLLATGLVLPFTVGFRREGAVLRG
ncbi:MAG: hypothetical protein R3F61_22010 [Myxococcota bacterium]